MERMKTKLLTSVCLSDTITTCMVTSAMCYGDI